MKATLIGLFVAVLLVGCVRDRLVDYYDNGQKKWERHWKGQNLDGPVTWWYENGEKRQQINYKNGKKEGLWIRWYENGQKKLEGNYQDGRLMSVVVWKPNGDKCLKTNLKNGNGDVGYYYESGQEGPLSPKEYRDGRCRLGLDSLGL